MFFYLSLLFILVPTVEVVLLLKLIQIEGFWLTLALVIITGVVGSTLARRQGWRVYSRIQNELGQGHMPTDALFDALLIFIAGLLLITPGILTDGVGFSLLVPPIRNVLKKRLTRWAKAHMKVQTFTSAPPHYSAEQDQTIDAYVVKDSSEANHSGDSSQ